MNNVDENFDQIRLSTRRGDLNEYDPSISHLKSKLTNISPILSPNYKE
jgi:hypothetical protein